MIQQLCSRYFKVYKLLSDKIKLKKNTYPKLNREFPIINGKAFAGVYKVHTKVHPNRPDKDPIPKSKQMQKFIKKNVECFPKFDLEGKL